MTVYDVSLVLRTWAPRIKEVVSIELLLRNLNSISEPVLTNGPP